LVRVICLEEHNRERDDHSPGSVEHAYPQGVDERREMCFFIKFLIYKIHVLLRREERREGSRGTTQNSSTLFVVSIPELIKEYFLSHPPEKEK
jgi:hypothetical protein